MQLSKNNDMSLKQFLYLLRWNGGGGCLLKSHNVFSLASFSVFSFRLRTIYI